MKQIPTYTVQEIKKLTLTMDLDSMKVLLQLIDEELDLYDNEDMMELCNVSIMMFTRSLLLGSFKNLK